HRLIAAGFLHFIRYLAGLRPRILKAAGIAPNFSPACAVGAFGTHCRRSGIAQIRLARWSPSSPPHLNPSVSPGREYPRPDGCDRACPVLPEAQFIGGPFWCRPFLCLRGWPEMGEKANVDSVAARLAL